MEGTTRRVHINAYNTGVLDNKVTNTRLTLLNCIPKMLKEQLKRSIHQYFVLVGILQLNRNFSANDPVTTWLPLGLVLAISMIKEAVDDERRRLSDRAVNSRSYTVCRGAARGSRCRSSDLRVGDILLLNRNDEVPADCVVLKTSDPRGGCYIQTTNVDGESDLKQRQAAGVTARLTDEQVSVCRGVITCAAPGAAMYSFEANFAFPRVTTSAVWEGRHTGDTGCALPTASLSEQQLLLASSHLRNTAYAFAAIVYAGGETKVGRNKRMPPYKAPMVERKIDTLVIGIFLGQFCVAPLLGVIGHTWMSLEGTRRLYLGDSLGTDALPAHGVWPPLPNVVVFSARFFGLMSIMVPISLRVNLEFFRILYAKWIEWDLCMYDAEKDTQAHALSTSLAENLGRIEYILADKTGTLTENSMTLQKCSIGNMVYGHSLTARDVWHDLALRQKADAKDETVLDFFRCLALNHRVVPSSQPLESTGLFEYASASPDEEALCSAAAFFGVVLTKRTANELLLSVGEEKEEESWALLNTLDFSSDRKHMAVVVREAKSGRIRVFLKGADDRVAEMLVQGHDPTHSKSHLDMYAELGLRTLLVATRDLAPLEYAEWSAAFSQAKDACENNKLNLRAINARVERELHLLGATAIEDKLQDGVPETVCLLRRASVKLWVLTGDKFATAVQVGRSCSLLCPSSAGAVLLQITGENADEVASSISGHLNDLSEGIYGHFLSESIPTSRGRTALAGIEKTDDATVLDEQKARELSIIVEGKALGHALESHRGEFASLAFRANCVICCRVTPAQKGLVARLVKHAGKATLAIGDGGNDVPMIQEAHVGVGITGKEGLQAARAADYSVGCFKFLIRLLLVHGRYSYQRTSRVTVYSFYRSIFISCLGLWYNVSAGLSGVSLVPSLYFATWSVFPVILTLSFGADSDVSEESCISFPQLYLACHREGALMLTRFGAWGACAVQQSAVVYLLTILSFTTSYLHPIDGAPLDQASTGLVCYTAGFMLQAVVVCTEHYRLSRINHGTLLLALTLYVCTFLITATLKTVSVLDMNLIFGLAPRMARDLAIVIGSVVIAVCAALPQIVLRCSCFHLAPRPHQVIQHYELRKSLRAQVAEAKRPTPCYQSREPS